MTAFNNSGCDTSQVDREKAGEMPLRRDRGTVPSGLVETGPLPFRRAQKTLPAVVPASCFLKPRYTAGDSDEVLDRVMDGLKSLLPNCRQIVAGTLADAVVAQDFFGGFGDLATAEDERFDAVARKLELDVVRRQVS